MEASSQTYRSPCGNFHSAPGRVALKYFRVLLREHLAMDALLHRRLHFLIRRPDVAQENIFAGRVLAQGFMSEVHVDAPGDGVSHHQRRRRQIVGLHQRIHAALEIPVAGEHGGHRQLLFGHARGDFFRQRTAVADTRGAAVAHQVEFQRFERGQQSRLAQIIHHHLRSRSETRLHPGFGSEPALDRFLCDQAGGHQHRGIRGVGATGDGRDHHAAVLNGRARSVHIDRRRSSAPSPVHPGNSSSRRAG